MFSHDLTQLGKAASGLEDFSVTNLFEISNNCLAQIQKKHHKHFKNAEHKCKKEKKRKKKKEQAKRKKKKGKGKKEKGKGK